MTPEQIQDLKEHVAETVRTVVNGKIDGLNLKLDNYIDNDMAWKERAEPLVIAYENTTWLSKIVLNIMKFGILLASAITAYLFIKDKIK